MSTSRGRESPADTIVACATPPGPGAIAVVRVSGGASQSILVGLLGPGEPLPAEPRRLERVTLRDGRGQAIDEALAVRFVGPRSYTGEDSVELHVHGAPVVVQTVVDRALELGARGATPGEFTLRAVLNGRMSLDQAEAVGDLVGASTEAQHRVALRGVRGEFRRRVETHLEGLEGILTAWRAVLDFPEYPTDGGEGQTQLALLTQIRTELLGWQQRASTQVRDRRTVVLCGAPNVGKSTLLNALAGEQRALVHGEPGTTRDPVEVELGEGLLRWSVIDTAGLRAGAVGLEAQGMELTFAAVNRADIVIWLLDPHSPVWPETDRLGAEPDLILGSKADLAPAPLRADREAQARARGQAIAGWIAAGVEAEVDLLRARIDDLLRPRLQAGEVVVTRQRHVEQLRAASDALGRILEAQPAGQTLDVLTMDLEEATGALGRILGRDVDAEVLDQIFSEFCIGK